MSEPRLISPMLDDFALGGSMSEHSGVNCYPAMRNDSDERYIVKTVSIPASQVQLDALLLTGAYKSAEDARAYFESLANGILEEVEILNKLSAQRGFLPYQSCQTVPLEEGVGYQVYLLSPYNRTLGRFLKRSPMTHLSAVNMGIDICAALALCREAGYLYVDLKPNNIFMTGEQEFRIGDLGFVSLNSLKYASVPDRCRSAYIPPEVADAYAQLNTTMDTYALGLVLYQVYNNGQLPFASEEERKELMDRLSKGEPMPAPMYADYEMAEIILKAIAYDPAQRWQDPNEMGHALISYMQRNEVNDVPITPPVIETVTEPEFEPEPVEEESEGEDFGEDWIDRMDAYLAEDGSEAEETDDAEPSLRELLGGDHDEAHGITTEELSDETAGILNLAQELIDHDAPEPAVAPEPIDIPMPDPLFFGEEEEQAQEEEPEETEELPEEPAEDGYDPRVYEEQLVHRAQRRSAIGRVVKKIFTVLLVLAVLAGIAYGGWYAYSNIYLQTVDSFTVDGTADQMTVSVSTNADPALLSVVCKDQHGNPMTGTLVNGVATFNDLTPGSQYFVSLEIEGFHQLVGQVGPLTYSTPQNTQIMNFTASTGPEDGSAVINFGVEGPEGEQWMLRYSAEGEAEKSLSFSGHTVTVTGLTVGSTYTFTLVAPEDVYLIGEHSMEFTASSVIYAQDLTVTGFQSDSITVGWNAPEGASVNGWVARCFNEEGFDQRLEVTDTTATFTGIDTGSAYTIEITAAGMTKNTILYVSANPLSVNGLEAEVSGSAINVTWDFEGVDPEGGWLLLYSVDGSTEQQVIKSDSPSAAISPVAPGSRYDIVIQSANAASIFGTFTTSAEVPAASGKYSGYGLSASEVTIKLYAAPEGDWNRRDLEDATTTFAPGSNMALVYQTNSRYNIDYTNIETLFVIRDADGKLVSISSSVRTWDAMWNNGYCEEQVNGLPATPGEYTLEIFVAGKEFATMDFTIA